MDCAKRIAAELMQLNLLIYLKKWKLKQVNGINYICHPLIVIPFRKRTGNN